ncbi:FkbM family methyltransferase [Massilia sp. Mn16-1_5]|uniref:FkbM family methyltransferase n=1 Tax=Massilia sp. Mn16-1_5 TaxID=2079199 RepID=UPI00109E6BE5|nr:FkbM family methyltransferase [Massilia sp. Mn16-1_5]THC45658.1 hypothetical protein C2862_03995 [Massilia sp. Mn16-1_5]
MERTYRTGLNIDVALTAASRRALAAASQPSQAAAMAAVDAGAADGSVPPATHDMTRQDLRGRVKRWLRRPAAAGFRLLKPFLRPIAFRTRRYLTEALHQDTLRMLADTQREVQRASSDMLREVQSAREMLRQEIHAVQARPMQEQRHLFAGLLQEQQATRDLLRRLLNEGFQRNAAEVMKAVSIGQTQFANIAEQVATTLAPRLDRLEQYGYASARRSMLHCAAGEVMVKTEVGYVMCSDSDLALLACLADTGDLERGTRLLIERLLQPGDTFVDVGANVGMHTLAASRALHGQGRIVAFEPFAATRQLLEKTVWINGLDALTEIHGSAVSDHEGVQTLFLGASSGHHSLYQLADDAPAEARVDVSTVRLESVIRPGQAVALLKIDAEGAELEVLRGALTVVTANPDIALIVEFGPAHLRRTGQRGSDWLAAFTRLGLEYRAIDAVSGTLSDITLAQLEAAESTNLLFARPGAAPWTRIGVPA